MALQPGSAGIPAGANAANNWSAGMPVFSEIVEIFFK
jgi:hypothetical protein